MHISVIIALFVYVVCLFVYHYTYFYITEHRGVETKKGRINECVESWIESALRDKEYLLVVHQIRNLVMAITFLATTAVLLMGFMIGFTNINTVIGELEGTISLENYPAWVVVGTLGYSILNFLLSLRYLTQLTILVKSDPEKLRAVEKRDPIKYLRKLFVNGNWEYTIGRRSMLYAIVAMSWFINVWLFIVLTIILTMGFAYMHDI